MIKITKIKQLRSILFLMLLIMTIQTGFLIPINYNSFTAKNITDTNGDATELANTAEVSSYRELTPLMNDPITTYDNNHFSKPTLATAGDFSFSWYDIPPGVSKGETSVLSWIITGIDVVETSLLWSSDNDTLETSPEIVYQSKNNGSNLYYALIEPTVTGEYFVTVYLRDSDNNEYYLSHRSLLVYEHVLSGTEPISVVKTNFEDKNELQAFALDLNKHDIIAVRLLTNDLSLFKMTIFDPDLNSKSYAKVDSRTFIFVAEVSGTFGLLLEYSGEGYTPLQLIIGKVIPTEFGEDDFVSDKWENPTNQSEKDHILGTNNLTHQYNCFRLNYTISSSWQESQFSVNLRTASSDANYDLYLFNSQGDIAAWSNLTSAGAEDSFEFGVLPDENKTFYLVVFLSNIATDIQDYILVVQREFVIQLDTGSNPSAEYSNPTSSRLWNITQMINELTTYTFTIDPADNYQAPNKGFLVEIYRQGYYQKPFLSFSSDPGSLLAYSKSYFAHFSENSSLSYRAFMLVSAVDKHQTQNIGYSLSLYVDTTVVRQLNASTTYIAYNQTVSETGWPDTTPVGGNPFEPLVFNVTAINSNYRDIWQNGLYFSVLANKTFNTYGATLSINFTTFDTTYANGDLSFVELGNTTYFYENASFNVKIYSQDNQLLWNKTTSNHSDFRYVFRYNGSFVVKIDIIDIANPFLKIRIDPLGPSTKNIDPASPATNTLNSPYQEDVFIINNTSPTAISDRNIQLLLDSGYNFDMEVYSAGVNTQNSFDNPQVIGQIDTNKDLDTIKFPTVEQSIYLIIVIPLKHATYTLTTTTSSYTTIFSGGITKDRIDPITLSTEFDRVAYTMTLDPNQFFVIEVNQSDLEVQVVQNKTLLDSPLPIDDVLLFKDPTETYYSVAIVPSIEVATQFDISFKLRESQGKEINFEALFFRGDLNNATEPNFVDELTLDSRQSSANAFAGYYWSGNKFSILYSNINQSLNFRGFSSNGSQSFSSETVVSYSFGLTPNANDTFYFILENPSSSNLPIKLNTDGFYANIDFGKTTTRLNYHNNRYISSIGLVQVTSQSSPDHNEVNSTLAYASGNYINITGQIQLTDDPVLRLNSTNTFFKLFENTTGLFVNVSFDTIGISSSLGLKTYQMTSSEILISENSNDVLWLAKAESSYGIIWSYWLLFNITDLNQGDYLDFTMFGSEAEYDVFLPNVYNYTINYRVVVDRTVPTITSFVPADGTQIEQDVPFVVAVVATDNIAIESIILDSNLTDDPSINLVFNGSHYITAIVESTVGFFDLTVTAIDLAGNTISSSHIIEVTTAVYPNADFIDMFSNAHQGLVNVSFTLDDINFANASLVLEGTNIGYYYSTGTYSEILDLSSYSIGDSITFTLKAIDFGGHETVTDAIVTITDVFTYETLPSSVSIITDFVVAVSLVCDSLYNPTFTLYETATTTGETPLTYNGTHYVGRISALEFEKDELVQYNITVTDDLGNKFNTSMMEFIVMSMEFDPTWLSIYLNTDVSSEENATINVQITAPIYINASIFTVSLVYETDDESGVISTFFDDGWFNFTLPAFSSGSEVRYYFEIYRTDNPGEVYQSDEESFFIGDTTPPTISITPDTINGSTFEGVCEFTVSLHDDYQLKSLLITANGQTITTLTSIDQEDWDELVTISQMAEDEVTIVITVTDASGNQATVTLVVTIIEAPEQESTTTTTEESSESTTTTPKESPYIGVEFLLLIMVSLGIFKKYTNNRKRK